MTVKLKLIVAACENRGIGYKGKLPWKLKDEMAYFTRMTTTVTDPSKKNAVIMGRNTWESIPKKYKPLSDRLNIVLSKSLKEVKEDAVVTPSLKDAISLLGEPRYLETIESVWVIGGSYVYEEALESANCYRIYVTEIKKNFECDTFLPHFPDNIVEVKDPQVPVETQIDNGIEYNFKVYEISNN